MHLSIATVMVLIAPLCFAAPVDMDVPCVDPLNTGICKEIAAEDAQFQDAINATTTSSPGGDSGKSSLSPRESV